MYCKICGADMPDNEMICPQCGCNNEINSKTATVQKFVWQPPAQIQASQKIRLIIEILICTIIIFFGIMTAFFGTVKICGIMMIIISCALFYLLYKNPPMSKENRSNVKLQGTKRVFLVIACIFTAFIFMFKGIVG